MEKRFLSAIERATEDKSFAAYVDDSDEVVTCHECKGFGDIQTEEGTVICGFCEGRGTLSPTAQPQRSEQEWTPEYVAGLMARSPLKNRESELLRGYGAVSDAHNAALAAVDLSILHQHDAEVRKPLVEALKKMPEVAYQAIIEHAGVELENLPNELQCICDDALAKVK